MESTQFIPYAETAMRIRKPISNVFEAFVNPEITTKFWFTKSSGRLEKGKTVEWIWEMYQVNSDIFVSDLVLNEKIEVQWKVGGGSDMIRVVWRFKAFDTHSAFVTIRADGIHGDMKTILAKVNDLTGGFTWVLAGLKAYLEYGIDLHLISDRFPDKNHKY